MPHRQEAVTDRSYIAVIDFGGQYAHLIAKRIRQLGVYSRVFPPMADVADLEDARGIVLSGGPQSVFGAGAIPYNPALLETDMPLLGLCYGHQLLAKHFNGQVQNLGRGEYGSTRMRRTAKEGGAPSENGLLAGVPAETEVWMSHGDTVVAPPPGFEVLASTGLCPVAAMAHGTRPVFGLQFHAEVTDTAEGTRIFENFLAMIDAPRGWTMEAFVAEALEEARTQVGDRNVLLFLSGGVDSTVAFALLTRALGQERVRGLLIDNGFLRKDEARGILERYAALGWRNVDFLDASTDFLRAVEGMSDPQKKRHAVGDTFLHVREDWLAAEKLDPQHWLLGQGTLYPDIIESGGSHHAEVIKSHHNRVDRIQEMIAAGYVVEPLKELYKDEVRRLGEALGLPHEMVWRHPFPGPGLSINVLCAQGDEDYTSLAATDAELAAALEGRPYTGKAIPVRSVGVQGDSRTYTPPAVISGPRDWEALEETSIHLTNTVRAVNRVVTLLAPETLPELVAHRSFCVKPRLDMLREADALVTDALREAGWLERIFQLLVILLPLGPEEGGECLVLRPVISEDVMTARFAPLPWDLLDDLVPRLMALEGVRAVLYDVTHKPPATFGWE